VNRVFPDGLPLAMIFISLAVALGVLLKTGNNFNECGVWWLAACINAHSIVTLYKGEQS
jgi:hypothetical protein